MRRIDVDPKARILIDEAFHHYAEEVGDFNLAIRFLDNTYELFRNLAQEPGIGHRWGSDDFRLEGIRVFSVQDFPYLVFYRTTPDSINIRYVYHTSRDIPNLF